MTESLQEDQLDSEMLKSSSAYEKELKEYNKNMAKIAKSIAKSMKHADVRKKIKDDALIAS